MYQVPRWKKELQQRLEAIRQSRHTGGNTPRTPETRPSKTAPAKG